MLQRLAKCANSSDSNICRNLHRLLAHSDFSLQVEIQHAIISFRHARTRRVRELPWPIMKLSSWVRYIMEAGGQLLLQGHHISQVHSWQQDLKEFWDLYERVDSTHPVFRDGLNRATTLPYFLHGDEGRGRYRQPIMVLSFQGLFSHLGKHRLNESGLQVAMLSNFIPHTSNCFCQDAFSA